MGRGGGGRAAGGWIGVYWMHGRMLLIDEHDLPHVEELLRWPVN